MQKKVEHKNFFKKSLTPTPSKKSLRRKYCEKSFAKKKFAKYTFILSEKSFAVFLLQ